MITVRISFEKKNEASYISLLDMQRVMQRVLKRSSLPVWHTLGFNPHIYMTFACPLSLGQESECECVDVKTEAEAPDFVQWQTALNAIMPAGIHVTRVAPVEMKADSIAFACYRISYPAAAAAVLGGVLVLSRMGGGLDPDQLLMTNPNGDSIWTFSLGYICRNLPATAKLLLRTIPEQGALWLQGVLGTTLGEPIVYRLDVSWLLGVGLVLALLSAALPVQGEQPPLGRHAAWGTAGIILCVVAASLVVALNWTPINYQTLFGLQGRYWLPVLPLVLVLCKRAGNVSLRRNASRGAALAVTACTLLTLLQGFGLYASWQPVS